MIKREQYYLDLISLEYNINPTAKSWLGAKHSETTRKKLILIKSGNMHFQETKKKISEAQNTTTFIYSLSYQLFYTFSFYRAAAKYFNIWETIIIKYAKCQAVTKKNIFYFWSR